jgi:hypothetical protein
MLYNHLSMTEDEAVMRLNSRFTSDIAIYDKIESEALEMADYMTSGISDQFPSYFVA